MAFKILKQINGYHTAYQKLIYEFPFLHRLSVYSTIVLIALIWLLFFNIPLLWRLGWLFDVLNTLAIFSLIIGIFGGLKPYLVLNRTPKPYKQLVFPVKGKPNTLQQQMKDMLISLTLIFSSLTVLIALTLIDPQLPELVINIMVIALGLILLFGLILFFRALKIHKLINRFFYAIINLLSLSWWKNIFTTPTHVSVSISLDKRNRIERLQDEIISESTKTTSFTETTYESLRKLNPEDYLIIEVKNNSNSFIQFHKLTSEIRLELPLVPNKESKQKLAQAIQFLKLNNVLKGFSILNLPLNPSTYYLIEKWIDQTDTIEGDLLVIICKEDYLQATNLGLGLLEKIHGWDKKQRLDYIVNSFNDSWWSKL